VIPARTDANSVILGYYGAACESATYAAIQNGFDKKYGINIELVKVDNNSSLNLIASGKIDATDGVLQSWLKPIQEGLDVRFTEGLHSGCMSAIVLNTSTASSWKDLKGKNIGVSGTIGGGSMNYAFRDIAALGLDPQNDYQWTAYSTTAALLIALEKGEIAAAVGGDTGLWTEVDKGTAKFLSYMATDSAYANEDCCLLAFNPDFAAKHLDLVTALTKALYDGSQWVQNNKAAAVQYEVDNQYVAGTVAANLRVVNSYAYTPGTNIGKLSLTNSINQFVQAKIIDQVTASSLVNKLWLTIPGVGN
jgi:NitT/TauT family transport system substrate-binding protein